MAKRPRDASDALSDALPSEAQRSRRRIEEHVRRHVTATLDKTVQDLTQVVIHTGADHIFNIQRAQDVLKDQLSREQKKSAVATSRLTQLQLHRESDQVEIERLTTVESKLLNEKARQKRLLEESETINASLQKDLHEIADERDAWQHQHYITEADLRECLRLVDEHARAEDRARALVKDDLPPSYTAVQHCDSGLSLCGGRPGRGGLGFLGFHNNAMQRLDRQSREQDGDYLVLGAFKLVADEAALLQMNCMESAFYQDVGTAILSLCTRTVNFGLFDRTIHWDRSTRLRLQRYWRNLDDVARSAVDMSLQGVVRPTRWSCPYCAESTCLTVEHERERVWRRSRVATARHLRAEAANARSIVELHVPKDLSGHLLGETMSWLDETFEEERQKLANVSSDRCDAASGDNVVQSPAVDLDDRG